MRRAAGESPGMAEVLAVCLCVSAAAVAGGLVGLIADPLRVAATWILVGSASLLAGRNDRRQGSCGQGRVEAYPTSAEIPAADRWRGWWAAAMLLLIVLPLLGLGSWVQELLLVSAVAAWLAAGRQGAAGRMFSVVSRAVLIWAAMIVAARALPWSWLIAEWIGGGLGQLSGLLASRTVQTGSTFAGVPLLGLLLLLYAGWLWSAEGPRLRRFVAVIVAAGSVHLFYLFLLGRSFDLAELLPEAPLPEFQHPYEPPDWRWSAAVGTLLPWNMPLVAVVLHTALLGLVWRWSTWPTVQQENAARPSAARSKLEPLRRWAWLLLAIALPVSATLCTGRADLAGKTLLASSQGRVDWERPQHDRYGQAAAGMFGMLPQLVQSLGGTLQVSDQLTEQELATANAVLLLHPAAWLSDEDCQRLLDYVRRGGALLVAAEPHRREGDFISGHNRLLQRTAISVRRDTAAAETSDWQDALQLAAHPVTAGLDTRRTPHFRQFGSSLDIRWPARPLIVGRWGWSDPGSDPLFTGVQHLERDERVGDMVLAAEQPWGRGRIIVLGNSFSLTNEGGVAGYLLSGRLLQYLTGPRSNPQAVGRQIATLAVLAGFCLFAIWAEPQPQAAAIVALALSLGISQQLSGYLTRVVPDGRLLDSGGGSRLAYIDASHLESYSDSHWSFDGINGIALTLMRSGMLTLSMPEVTAERLERAGVVLSIGPARGFSRREQQLLEEFVTGGGVLICTVGAEESAASNPLLTRFGIQVPSSPVPTLAGSTEPEPLGRIRALYLEVQPEDGPPYQLAARFHAGWPVELQAAGLGEPGPRGAGAGLGESGPRGAAMELQGEGQVLAYGRPDQPVAVMRRFGAGRVVVIGDTCFAMNKNLEYTGGEPFEGDYENSNFWRWLISSLVDEQAWVPPPPAGGVSSDEQEAEL